MYLKCCLMLLAAKLYVYKADINWTYSESRMSKLTLVSKEISLEKKNSIINPVAIICNHLMYVSQKYYYHSYVIIITI